MEEYETYVKLSDHYHKNFGGKKSLYKLIPLVAPYWKYKRLDADFMKLYKKYGIDSTHVERKILDWEKSLNKQLIDSFEIAFIRDQKKDSITGLQLIKNFEKNAQLLIWTLNNFGYPSMQKIGLETDNGVFMPMLIYLNHMAQTKDYPYFKIKLLDYIKSGECPPRDYAEMIERYNQINNLDSEYGLKGLIKDTAIVNHNRKLIGFPSYKQRNKITKDFWKKEKEK